MTIDKARVINDFIFPNKKQYSIPVYQRNYEWSNEQCIKLFQDIIIAYKTDKNHFCGSIVCAPLKEEHHISYYVIIDGQQRLTTIYLLLKALYDKAENENAKEAIGECLFNYDKFDELNINDATKLKLKPIKSDNQQLLFLMENKYDQVDKSSEIWHNYELFGSLIQEQLDKGLYTKDIYRGIERLTCAQIKLDNEDNAQEIFERINSTGVPLSLADKIRNYVLMTDANQEYLYENYWLKIEQNVNKEYITAFFLDFLNFKVEGFAKESEAYDVFKKCYEDKDCSKEQILIEVLHYAELYKTFLFGSNKYPYEVNAILTNLHQLKQTTIFLFLFNLFDDYENGVISIYELQKVLSFLLNYSVRRMICEVPSNSLRGLFKTLHSRVFKDENNKHHYYDAIVSFFLQLNTKDAIPDDDKFVIALKQNNLYRKLVLCKYLLATIENQGKEKLDMSNLTIEHIMPQNNNLSTSWQKMLGEDWKIVQEKYLHTLGNLTLTGYNSELGDKPFIEKQRMLEEANSKVVALYADVKGKTEWNEETINVRAENLSQILLKLFPIEQPEQVITFRDSRYEEYSCEDPDVATYKTPNYFILQGEIVSVSNFAEMLQLFVEKLYEQNPALILSLAKTEEKICGMYFSYSPLNEKATFKFRNADIYSYLNFCSSQIIRTIRTLLDRFDIDRDDFVYSARLTKSSVKEKIEEGGLSERDTFLLRYWEAFTEYAYKNEEFVKLFGNRRSAQAQSWLNYAVGKKHCSISTLAKTQKKIIGVDFYIDNYKSIYYELRDNKDEVERVIGVPLQYAEASSDCRLFYEVPADLEDESRWNEYFAWYVDMTIRFRKITELIKEK